MFHGTDCPRPPDCRTCSHFQGDFFIGCPLAVDLLVTTDGLSNFRTRCPGICRGDRDPGFISPPGNRFVAEHKLFHKSSHLEPVISVANSLPAGPVAICACKELSTMTQWRNSPGKQVAMRRASEHRPPVYCVTPIIFMVSQIKD